VALHTELPIHRTGVQLLQFAFRAQENMPRGVKRSLGDKIAHICVEMLDQMALANATRGAARAAHIEQLLKHHRALTVLLRVGHDARYISTSVWTQSVQLLDSIGKQGGGWLKAKGTAPVSPNSEMAPAA
jgi:hypothetical protein